MIEILIDAV